MVRPLRTFQDTIKKLNEGNLLANKPRTGQRRKMSNRTDAQIALSIKANPFSAAQEIKDKFNLDSGPKTIRG